MAPQTKKVAILIFDDVEVLDFCGPFEVFAVSGAYEERRFLKYTPWPSLAR